MSENFSTTVKIDPCAALNETYALSEFYKNRNLILANENISLRKTIEVLQGQITTLAQQETEQNQHSPLNVKGARNGDKA